jgi:hypothetical protein
MERLVYPFDDGDDFVWVGGPGGWPGFLIVLGEEGFPMCSARSG